MGNLERGSFKPSIYEAPYGKPSSPIESAIKPTVTKLSPENLAVSFGLASTISSVKNDIRNNPDDYRVLDENADNNCITDSKKRPSRVIEAFDESYPVLSAIINCQEVLTAPDDNLSIRGVKFFKKYPGAVIQAALNSLEKTEVQLHDSATAANLIEKYKVLKNRWEELQDQQPENKAA